MALADDLRYLLRTYLIPDDFVAIWAAAPLRSLDELGPGKDNTWLAAPFVDGSWVVGGTDRGRFASYDRYETLELCANALRHLYFAPVESVVLTAAEAEFAGRRAYELARLVTAKGQVSADEVPVGLAVDRFGPLSGHMLFTWRTSFPMRSAPPTDLSLPYTQLIVRRPLPTPFRTGAVVPWFEQPGGGAALSMPRCIRWYYDAGYLDTFRTPDQV